MITKAIIPVAGIGSRFLPASKSIPKEMFPIVDKPVIHYIVEDAVKSGITDIIFVTSSNKKTLEDYFDQNFELEYRLTKKGKDAVKEEIRALHRMANFYFIRQPEPRGDGDAIIRAARMLDEDESCVVMFGDDVILSGDEEPITKKLLDVYEKYKAPVFAVEEVSLDDVGRYGIIGGKEIEPCVHEVSTIIEKPDKKIAPSRLAIVGRYVMTPHVFQELRAQTPAEDGEIRTSHGIRDALRYTPVYGYQFDGTRYDCGSKRGWLMANVALGMRDPETCDALREFLQKQGKSK